MDSVEAQGNAKVPMEQIQDEGKSNFLFFEMCLAIAVAGGLHQADS